MCFQIQFGIRKSRKITSEKKVIFIDSIASTHLGRKIDSYEKVCRSRDYCQILLPIRENEYSNILRNQ